MINDESNQDDGYYRLGKRVAEGWGSGFVPLDAFRDFEVRFLDHTIMRQIYIASSLITHKDVAFLREQLDVLTPGFRAFVLESAKLICEAGE